MNEQPVVLLNECVPVIEIADADISIRLFRKVDDAVRHAAELAQENGFDGDCDEADKSMLNEIEEYVRDHDGWMSEDRSYEVKIMEPVEVPEV